MSWFEAVILGLIQGLTEFLPISSSAHILVLSRIFGWSDPGAAFTAVTQIGTELAVIVYFRQDIARIIVTWVRSLRDRSLRPSLDARMGWYVIIGTIPIGLLGFAFAGLIETAARNLWITAAMLALFAVVLGVADAFGRRTRPLEDLTTRDAILYGLAQACALIPGVSRSGATISMGLGLGYTREAATRYSFLLAIPAVLASGLFEATKIGKDTTVAWGPTLLATIIAFAVGYTVIVWLLRYIATNSFRVFVLYRLVFAAIIVVLLATGLISAT